MWEVIKQTKGLVQVMVGEDELYVYDKDLEQLMPDPGDNAKMLQKNSSVQCFWSSQVWFQKWRGII